MDKVAQRHNDPFSQAAWAVPLLFHVLTEQTAVIFYACGKICSQRSLASVVQLKLFSSFALCPQKHLLPSVSVSQWETSERSVILCQVISLQNDLHASIRTMAECPMCSFQQRDSPYIFFSLPFFFVYFPGIVWSVSSLTSPSFGSDLPFFPFFFLFFPWVASLEPPGSLAAESADLQHPPGADSVSFPLWVPSKSSSSKLQQTGILLCF